MNEWISVKERLPETGRWGSSRPMLIAVSDDETNEINTILRTGWYDEIEGCWVYCENAWEGRRVDKYDAVTHWMPLPEPPNDITPDDCVELCQWYMDGEKEADNPGVYLDSFGSTKLSCNIDDGIPIQEIIDNLPPETGIAFREIVDILVKYPDKIERCEKYADALDKFDKDMSEKDWGEFAPFFGSGHSWREPWFNCVVVEGYSKNAMEKLFHLGFQWEREDGGCGGFRVFGSHHHVVLEDGGWIDAFDFCDFLSVSDDERLIRFTDAEAEPE